MDAGGLAQMSTFPPAQASGLASRRGGTNVKPLSFDTLRSAEHNDTAVPTPRTSRGHMLAGLRTAPKTATAAAYPGSPVTANKPAISRNVSGSSLTSNSTEFNGPKSAMPRFAGHQKQQNYATLAQMTSQYTPDHILAPPEIQLDEQDQEQMDPDLYQRLVHTNMYLAQQQQHLQQQLLEVQAAAQQFQGLSQNPQMQQYRQQQQQLAALYGQTQPARQAQQIYAYVDPTTGQTQYFTDQGYPQYVDQTQMLLQQQQQQLQLQLQQMQLQQAHVQAQAQAHMAPQQAPRVQISPPTENAVPANRSSSPPKRNETPSDHAPLPPPSANAFRRGHKKVTSVAANNNANASNLTIATEITEDPKSAGPKSNSFPANASGTYGPGQARAGEHPVRQPRGPPSIEELRAKPTAKFEGSKNFATRTRRSAVHNLVRAGLVRRKGTSSSTGSMSPVSETAEEADTPITDNESDSGRSGSGSLAGDAESRVNTRSPPSGWGAIGSDRPNSRSKDRKSENCVEDHSFAGIFKNAGREVEGQDQRKAPMLVLTSAEKRKTTPMYA
ncbi:hypothetical protein CFO_g714 [Ceratocystis platani]|uniref:Uncharacterized protein n=1 Tax=Ceratocystis fimbriata f. sp. platani TaxID=88771 RepID=A0A0F8B7N6_CERFI|nr:hypothetical protein CFO_g714 [Ceratocystis platani]